VEIWTCEIVFYLSNMNRSLTSACFRGECFFVAKIDTSLLLNMIALDQPKKFMFSLI